MKGAMKDLLTEADRLEIRDKAPLVFCDRIFNSKILNQIKEHRLLLLRYDIQHDFLFSKNAHFIILTFVWPRHMGVDNHLFFYSFCGNNIRAQKNLLKGIEILIGMPEHSAVLIPKVAHILKALYDAGKFLDDSHEV